MKSSELKQQIRDFEEELYKAEHFCKTNKDKIPSELLKIDKKQREIDRTVSSYRDNSFSSTEKKVFNQLKRLWEQTKSEVKSVKVYF